MAAVPYIVELTHIAAQSDEEEHSRCEDLFAYLYAAREKEHAYQEYTQHTAGEVRKSLYLGRLIVGNGVGDYGLPPVIVPLVLLEDIQYLSQHRTVIGTVSGL